ncbi:SRPBCC family protein [Elizabethkingia meningoseptica]|uniref:SRPBCC family protein n=1 Tax=Elizabethkingia meningoseptica TaxID=238 RepID=UPI003891A9C8
METLSYNIEINAPQQKVWNILWNEDSYKEWTKFFSPDSTMQSDWKVNGRTLFVNSKGDGMVSTIDRLDEPHQIIFKHLGMIQNGVEDLHSKDVVEWSGAQEKYFLTDIGDKTKLHVEVQVDAEWKDHLNQGFIKGLNIVKELAEK